jgi:Phage capsid protein
MSTTIDQAFVRQYETEVAMVFQRQGGYLRPTLRVKDGVKGKSTTWQKIAKGVATTKARHGVITPMNQDHTAIECTLSDFYAGDWVDKLDEAKINHDERMAIATGGAWALGRKVDDQILTELANTTQSAISWTYGTVQAIENNLLKSIRALDGNDVPNDGQRFCVLTPVGYSAAMKVPSFASADYVDPTGRPFATNGIPQFTWRRWMGVLWTAHTGVSGINGATAKGFAYHKFSGGYATGLLGNEIPSGSVAVGADITWHGDRAAFFINHMMSGGAKLIDDTGVIPLTLDDTAALPTAIFTT